MTPHAFVPLIAATALLAQCNAAPSAGQSPDASEVVRSREALLERLEEAKGGETILLAPGDYGDLRIVRQRFSAPVTIKAAAIGVELGRIQIIDSGNLSFEGVAFHLKLAPGETPVTPAILVRKGADLSFRNVRVHGSLDQDPGNDGYGMRIIEAERVAVTGSTFEQLGRGMVFLKVNQVNVSGNDIHDIRSDGMNFAETNDVTVDGNRIRDFFPAKGDHADGIQFLTKNTAAPQRRISITNNVLLQGTGEGIQGIFLKDETTTMPYEDVRIANNLVYMDMYNGITVARGRGVEIVGNTVLSRPGDKIRTRIWLDYVDGARVENNVADIFINLQSQNVAARENVFLHDSPGQASRIPDLAAGAKARLSDLVFPGRGFQPAKERGAKPDK